MGRLYLLARGAARRRPVGVFTRGVNRPVVRGRLQGAWGAEGLDFRLRDGIPAVCECLNAIEHEGGKAQADGVLYCTGETKSAPKKVKGKRTTNPLIHLDVN